MIRYLRLPSPIGPLSLAENDEGLVAILFAGQVIPPEWRRAERLQSGADTQLSAYFAGELKRFDLPLAPEGSEFQLRVWREVERIPYGATGTYREIALALGDPRAVRAVGAANGRNPLPIVVPCHRVLGSDGSLTGYAGGLGRKSQLLALEQPERYGNGPLFSAPG